MVSFPFSVSTTKNGADYPFFLRQVRHKRHCVPSHQVNCGLAFFVKAPHDGEKCISCRARLDFGRSVPNHPVVDVSQFQFSSGHTSRGRDAL